MSVSSSASSIFGMFTHAPPGEPPRPPDFQVPRNLLVCFVRPETCIRRALGKYRVKPCARVARHLPMDNIAFAGIVVVKMATGEDVSVRPLKAKPVHERSEGRIRAALRDSGTARLVRAGRLQLTP